MYIDEVSGMEVERAWITAVFNFDNLGNALLSLFVTVTLDGYNDILVNAMAITEKGQRPKQGNYSIGFFYFMAFILVCAFCLLNLYIGVVFYQFSRIKLLSQTGSAFLTLEQQVSSKYNLLIYSIFILFLLKK